MATSNFLIDTSKKAFLRGSKDKGDVLGKYLLMGDIDPKSLKQVGFTYKEEFEEGSNVLDAAWNKYSTQFKSVIDGLLTESLKGKFTNTLKGSEDSDMKAKVTTLMAMALQTTGQSDADVAEILEGFNLSLRYRLPYRKKMPAIQQSGNKFTIQFAYGKCNKFNAKEEVWEPVMKIKEILFPTVKPEEGHSGLIRIGGTSGVPYTQQSLFHIVNGAKQKVFGDDENYKDFNLVSASKDIATSARAMISDINENEAITAATNYFNDLKSTLNAEVPDEKEDKETRASIISNKKDAINKLKKFVEQAHPEKKDLKYMMKNDGYNTATFSGWSDWSNSKNMAETVENKWSSWVEEYRKDNVLLEDLGDNKFNVKVVAADESKKTKGALLDILRHVVNYQMYIEGAAAEAVWKSISESANVFYLYYGYPQMYYHSQDDINTYCTNTANAYIKIGPFLPENVEILFDYDHPDSEGYPMAATINFNQIFAIAPFGEGLALKGEGRYLLGEPGAPVTPAADSNKSSKAEGTDKTTT